MARVKPTGHGLGHIAEPPRARRQITQAELLDALASAVQGNAPEEARTAPEIQRETGIPRDRVLEGLHALDRAGRLAKHWVPRRRLDGHWGRVIAYTVLPTVTVKRSVKKSVKRASRG